MPIVKTDVPMTSRLCSQTIRQLTQAYPTLQSRVLTESAYGRPVEALTFGSGPRKVLYSAAHHANEWITATVLLQFMEDLARSGDPGAVNVCAVPMVNPDGVDLVTGAIAPGSLPYSLAQVLSDQYPDIPFPQGWKANLLGVDLNLQYPAGWLQAREIKFSQGYTRPGPRDYVGRAPLNQLESRALAAFTRSVDPALVIALHTQGRVIYWQFDDIEVPGARELGEEFAAVSGYTLADTPFESSFAGYKDWFIQEFRRPGYTVEMGEGENPLPLTQFPEIYAAVAPILYSGLKIPE